MAHPAMLGIWHIGTLHVPIDVRFMFVINTCSLYFGASLGSISKKQDITASLCATCVFIINTCEMLVK